MTAGLSVQLYSLGAAPALDPFGVAARLAALGYRGVEPVLASGASDAMRDFARSMGAPDFPPVDAATLKRALDEHGLVAHASHVQLPEGSAAEQILDEQEMLGSSTIIVPALFDTESGSIESFADRGRIEQLADRFSAAAERAAARGIRVGYHNHFWEFATTIDGRSGLELFYELASPAVVAEIDLYWAQLGGRDPVDLVRSLGDRVVLVHVKDGDGQMGTPSCNLGDGVADVPASLAAATAAEWHVVELEGLDDDAIWPALEASRDYLLHHGLTAARS